jgi:hypothetical protein
LAQAATDIAVRTAPTARRLRKAAIMGFPPD